MQFDPRYGMLGANPMAAWNNFQQHMDLQNQALQALIMGAQPTALASAYSPAMNPFAPAPTPFSAPAQVPMPALPGGGGVRGGAVYSPPLAPPQMGGRFEAPGMSMGGDAVRGNYAPPPPPAPVSRPAPPPPPPRPVAARGYAPAPSQPARQSSAFEGMLR